MTNTPLDQEKCHCWPKKKRGTTTLIKCPDFPVCFVFPLSVRAESHVQHLQWERTSGLKKMMAQKWQCPPTPTIIHSTLNTDLVIPQKQKHSENPLWCFVCILTEVSPFRLVWHHILYKHNLWWGGVTQIRSFQTESNNTINLLAQPTTDTGYQVVAYAGKFK